MNLIKKYLWLIMMGIGFLGFLFVWFCMPHNSDINHIGEMMLKLIIFGFIVLGMSFFPNTHKYKYILLFGPILVFLCYIIPRMSYFSLVVTEKDAEIIGEAYTILYLICYPMVVLSMAFAYRLGGGSPGKTAKFSFGSATLLFSGLLDAVWNFPNRLPIPETLPYAKHIIIFFGRAPRWIEVVIFAICHIPLFIFILWLPLDKWFCKWGLLDSETEVTVGKDKSIKA